MWSDLCSYSVPMMRNHSLDERILKKLFREGVAYAAVMLAVNSVNVAVFSR